MLAQLIYAASTHTASSSPISTYSVNSSGSNAVATESNMLYDEMSLGETGLAKKAFEYAYRGYKNLLDRGLVSRQNIISVIDFSQSSRNKRLYIIDIASKSILMNTFVAHGRNSGKEFATTFSNSLSSLKSSLGFYITKDTYFGEHGLSLRIDGLERGINDNAVKRAVVIHGADYVGDDFDAGPNHPYPEDK